MKWATGGSASSLGRLVAPCHIKVMGLKFTSRKPQPRKGATVPLSDVSAAAAGKAKAAVQPKERPKELGGPSGPEPTRYGDWERKGICVDF